MLNSIRPQLQTGIGYPLANCSKKTTPKQLTNMFQLKFSNDKEPQKKEDSEQKKNSETRKDNSIQANKTIKIAYFSSHI